MAPPNALLGASDEASVQAAIASYQRHDFDSISAAAAYYGVNRLKVSRRLKGMPSVVDRRQKTTKLSVGEEQELVNKVLDMDSRGFAPTLSVVGDMANCILLSRGGQPVGKNWSQRFVSSNQQLRTRISRPIDHQRARMEDPVAIRKLTLRAVDIPPPAEQPVSWHQTPANSHQADFQFDLIKQAALNNETPTKTVAAVEHLRKALHKSKAQEAMWKRESDAARDLINTLQKRRTVKKRYVAQGAYTREQFQAAVVDQTAVDNQLAQDEARQERAVASSSRAKKKCGMCRQEGHTRQHCPLKSLVSQPLTQLVIEP